MIKPTWGSWRVMLLGAVMAAGPHFILPASEAVALAAVPLDQAGASVPARHFDAVVAASGSGTHTTVQAAIAAVPDDNTNTFRILIKSGVYDGPFMVPKGKAHMCLVGEGMENTILTWPYNVYDRGTNQHYQFDPGLVILGNDFSAKNLTIRNTSGDHGQALAVRVDADRAVFKNCRILGWQDTLMVNKGRQYFTNCFIEGRVDFIYGDGQAVFEGCTIHSRNGGFLTAASTPASQPFGFVFIGCNLTGDSAPWVDPTGKIPTVPSKDPLAYLGRPWRPSGSVAFIHCEMGAHIRPEGWHNWGRVENERTARYVEFGNTGPGAKPGARVKWARSLSAGEAAAYTAANILKGNDAWNPRATE